MSFKSLAETTNATESKICNQCIATKYKKIEERIIEDGILNKDNIHYIQKLFFKQGIGMCQNCKNKI